MGLRPRPHPLSTRVTLFPEGGPISDDALPRLAGGGHIVAEIEVPESDSSGVLFALGDWTGGFATFVDDGIPTVVAATPGGEIVAVAENPVSPGRHRVGCRFTPLPGGGVRVEVLVDDAVAASVDSDHEFPHAWQHGGTSLTLGYDRGLPVCRRYEPPFAWNGTLDHVVFDVERHHEPDPDEVLRIAMQVD